MFYLAFNNLNLHLEPYHFIWEASLKYGWHKIPQYSGLNHVLRQKRRYVSLLLGITYRLFVEASKGDKPPFGTRFCKAKCSMLYTCWHCYKNAFTVKEKKSYACKEHKAASIGLVRQHTRICIWKSTFSSSLWAKWSYWQKSNLKACWYNKIKENTKGWGYDGTNSAKNEWNSIWSQFKECIPENLLFGIIDQLMISFSCIRNYPTATV